MVRAEQVLEWFHRLAEVYAENRQLLTELDAAIGDADHGINMDRGFTAVRKELASKPQEDIGAILKTASLVLIRIVGGASGPLYGTFFLRASLALAGKTWLDAADILTLFTSGTAGVRERGKASPGDKTMLDALIPAVEAMRKSVEAGNDIPAVLQDAVAAAEAGLRATIPMQARKGRASYLGPRSVGHADPGATSSYLLIRTAAKTWRAA
jgi:dihydroxyacetone kinase-like protein